MIEKSNICYLFLLIIFGCNAPDNKSTEKQTKETTFKEASESDSSKRQILYHGNCSYSLCETEGWVSNANPPQRSDDVKNLVLYEPKGTTKHNAPIGITSNVIFMESYEGLSFKEYLKGDREAALERGEKVVEGSPIKTEDSKIAIVRKYFIEKVGQYFAIAYINEGKYVIMVTFSCKDMDDFNTYYKAFESIVQSYTYLGIIMVDK